VSTVAENYLNTLNEVKTLCEKSGRDSGDCILVAVSKTKPVELLKEAYEAGCRDFGENYVQELVDKIPQLPDDIRWHMIGHLQTNKVKYIVGKTYLIHSVDSVKLAREIGKQSEKLGITSDILLEVNIASEESKFGFKPEETADAVREIASIPGVRIKGLMTSAPICEDPEQNREFFHNMKQLSIDIKKQKTDNVYMDCLSMGMSGDYETAVDEGSTYVRVGTAIFGARDYHR
jgi:hypothetical protein